MKDVMRKLLVVLEALFMVNSNAWSFFTRKFLYSTSSLKASMEMDHVPRNVCRKSNDAEKPGATSSKSSSLIEC